MYYVDATLIIIIRVMYLGLCLDIDQATSLFLFVPSLA